ncbi:MAG: homoserine kinase [Pseudomonadota bacterium]
MAVYTSVSDDDLASFLSAYDIGAPLAFKGIAEGVENSNYYLETTQGRYILTLFEKRVDPADLPYFIGLKQHLSEKGFLCPKPIEGKDGRALRRLAGRPALIVSFLNGLSPKKPSLQQCFAMGAGLAQLHQDTADFSMVRKNALGPESWPKLWQGRADAAEALSPGLADLIDGDLLAIEEAGPESLEVPRGTIHADLFPDNSFFLGAELAGVIDFYFACTDALVFDLAVCLNAWAFEADGAFNFSKGARLISGYESVKHLSETERSALPLFSLGAALRFFLTRLVDWTETPADALVKPHDPLDYAKRLKFHRTADHISQYGG